MPISHVTLDTTFKQFVEEARGLRLAHVKSGTVLYRKLVKEFNRLKQTFIDGEEEEMRRQARVLNIEAGLETMVLVGIAYVGVVAAIA